MSTNINNSLLKNWIIEKVGNTLNLREARDLSIEDAYQNSVEEMDEIYIDDIFDNFNYSDLYEEFATLYVTEQDKKTVAKDKEEEKEEQAKIKDKNEAGV